ncbi:MAG: hypothetical protein U0996_25190 [Planctomycetaceae bacterium]
MSSEMSAGLKLLHELLLKLAEAEGAMAEGPRLIGVAERQVTLGEQQIEAQKQVIKEVRKSADDFNLKLKTKEGEILKLQGQLNTATSNKEYDIIKGQIETGKKDRGEIEEQGLMGLEAVDEAQKKLKELEADLQKRKQQVQSVKANFEAEKPKLEGNIASLQSEIAECEKIIPASDQATWKRLRVAHSAAALAPLDGDFCSACSNRVTTQDQVRIRTSNLVICRGCGRILYQA